MNTSFYCDTSALVKLYHREAGTERMEEIFRQEDKTLIISELAIVEFYSTLARKMRTGEINPWRPRRKPIRTSRQTASGVLLLLPLAVL